MVLKYIEIDHLLLLKTASFNIEHNGPRPNLPVGLLLISDDSNDDDNSA